MADYDRVVRKLDYLDETKQQIKEAIIEKGQTIEDTDPFRDYVEKIREMTTGDIRLFSTIAEMNSDQKPKKDNDLAVVYDNTIQPLTETSTISAIVIPRVVYIGTTYGEMQYLTAKAIDTSINAKLDITIPMYTEPNIEYMTIQLDNGDTNISLLYEFVNDNTGMYYRYLSGTTYNKLSQIESQFEFVEDEFTFDFKTSLNIEQYHNVFTGLFNVRVANIVGMYEYKMNNYKSGTVEVGNDIYINLPANKVNLNVVDYIDMNIMNTDIHTLSNLDNFVGIFVLENPIINHYAQTLKVYTNHDYILKYNDKLYICQPTIFDDEESATSIATSSKYIVYNFDFVNWSYTNTAYDYIVLPIELGLETKYILVAADEFDSTTIFSGYSYNYVTGGSGNYQVRVIEPTTLNSFTEFKILSFINAKDSGYIQAPTQLNVVSNSHLVTNKIALGNNGVYKGDSSFLNNISTKEYRDYFLYNLPDSPNRLYSSDIIQYGNQCQVYNLVKRTNILCDEDIEGISTEHAITTIIEDIASDSYANSMCSAIYNSTYNYEFSIKYNNQVYCGYVGYELSERQVDDIIAHETITSIKCILINVDTNEVYRTIDYTTSWKPFNGFGNGQYDPDVNIESATYNFDSDEFIFVVDTGNSVYSFDNGPFVGVMRLNATTKVATTYSYEIGKNGITDEYIAARNIRYDITTSNFIVALYSGSDKQNLDMQMIIKIKQDGTKTIWLQADPEQNITMPTQYIVNTAYVLADKNDCLSLDRPIYTYTYFRSGTATHILRNINNDEYTEIPGMNNGRFAIQNNYLYYTNYAAPDTKLIKLDLNTMTYTIITTTDERLLQSSCFLRMDNQLYILSEAYRKLYSVDDLSNWVYICSNISSFYNSMQTFDITYLDRYIYSSHPIISYNSNGYTLTDKRQMLYEWELVNSLPVTTDLCMAYPYAMNNEHFVTESTYLFNSILIAKLDYTGTIDPFDYQRALRTALRIEGKSIV